MNFNFETNTGTISIEKTLLENYPDSYLTILCKISDTETISLIGFTIECLQMIKTFYETNVWPFNPYLIENKDKYIVTNFHIGDFHINNFEDFCNFLNLPSCDFAEVCEDNNEEYCKNYCVEEEYDEDEYYNYDLAVQSEDREVKKYDKYYDKMLLEENMLRQEYKDDFKDGFF